MAPIAIGLTAAVGWASALQWLGFWVLLALPAVFTLKGNANALAAQAAVASGQTTLSARQAIGQALATPSYRYLAAGFLICGFHVVLLATHLPGVIAACGLAHELGGWALALIGLFNIVRQSGHGLGSRALAHEVAAVAALCDAGYRGDRVFNGTQNRSCRTAFCRRDGREFSVHRAAHTVGLVAKMFGTANMAMLFGIVILAHQVGGFFWRLPGRRGFPGDGQL